VTIFQAIVLGIVQGATEFIPVSSSGHLVLVPWLLGWQPPGLTFTIFAHLGTAIGVLIGFWRDWWGMFRSTLRWIGTRKVDSNVRLVGLIALGLVPAVVIGGLFSKFFERVFEEPIVAAFMLLVTAVLLVVGERLGRLTRSTEDMTWVDAIIIGLAQALAIMPGISRSGSTIAAARMRNFKREEAARYSFMLLMPLVIGVAILQGIEIAVKGIALQNIMVLVAAFLSALISAIFVMRWLLNFLRSRSTSVFAIYCVFASVVSLSAMFLRG